jgi:flavin-dependent dehydrogenase
MLLARKGYRVLLTDKATFPSDIMSTHFIHPRGVAQLKRWGLLERVIASNCPPVTKGSFDLGTFTLVGETLPIGDVAAGYVPRRKILDKILVDAAVQAGAELRENFCIRELLTEGDRVVGIRGQSAGGAPVTEKATLVVGADGMRSLVAQQVQAPVYNTVPSLTCGYYAYWSGVPVEGVELYPRDRCTLITFPTNDHLACVIVVRSHDQFQTIRTNVAEQYMKTLQLAPSLAQRVQNGRQEERLVGTADLPNFFRKPYGPGWALVGDAGYHKDPILGHGISDAFHDAELLATAIDEGLSGRRPLQKALAYYERQRNEDGLPIYEMSVEFAELKPPSTQLQQLFNALRTNQTELNRYFAAIEGTISPSAFFAPDNIARIIAGANQRMPA